MTRPSLGQLADTMATIQRRLDTRRRRGLTASRTLEGELESARDADRVLALVRRLRQETAQC